MRKFWFIFAFLPLVSMAGTRVDKLIRMNFQYVRLVHSVSESCVETAKQLERTPSERQLIVEGMRCYSFLLEKREKLEEKVLKPLRKLNFPNGSLSDNDKKFVVMLYLIDENLEVISAKMEPFIKKHRK